MQNNLEQQYLDSFTRPIIRLGRLTNLMAFFLCFLPPLTIYFVWGEFPGWDNIFEGWVLIASIYLIYAVVEPVSYYAILGLPGTYMSFLSGNISNMRVPCSSIAQEVLGVEPGTKKAELVSTLGIAGSIITNIIVVTIAAFGGAALMSIFPLVVVDAFSYVSPAIFGAMFGMYWMKNIKIGLFSLVLVGLMLTFLLPYLPVFVILLIAVFGSVAFALVMNKPK